MKIIIKLYLVISFLVFYFFKLVQANIYIAYDILTPKTHTNPGFVWVPLKTSSDLGILLFSNLLSMTPGTLSVDITKDRKNLLVHYLYNDTENSIITDIDKIQEKIIKLMK